ncbi:hypothetical protein HPB51_027489 [Rhipicephalus microplus]|uniref:Regulatory protein zeste n=1 Tax=Rhipicephalus microplus TaxID=6941 RepID=A0A9J6D040_RHIMP|nr:hypothetical protein HPB51_027489 [Rhipicephalus microplus]
MSFNDDGGVARDGRKTTATRFVFMREERELLVNLVTRHKAVIENKRTDALTKRAKDSAWEKLTSEYNSQPGIRRVTVAQLLTNGAIMSFNDDGGVARDGRKTTATRFVFMREERELLVNLVTRHKAVIENKRTDALTKRAKDSAWEKLTSEYNSQPGIRRVTVAQLHETIQPQLRSSEGAGSPGPHTTQPPTEGACASCPSDTLAVVAPVTRGHEQQQQLQKKMEKV